MMLDSNQSSELQTLNVFHHTETIFEFHRLYLHIYLVHGIRKNYQEGWKTSYISEDSGEEEINVIYLTSS